MLMIGLADIHGKIEAIRRIREPLAAADMVLLIGDLTHFGYGDAARKVMDAVLDCNRNVRAVSGNCDYAEVETVLEEKGVQLHRRAMVVDGLGFIGAGASLTTPFNTPNELTEQDYELILEDAFAALPDGTPFILVAHQPPFDTRTDRLGNGTHVGSHAVRAFIEKRRPLACLTGHIHESRDVDRIGGTWIVNPGPLANGWYARVRVQGSDVDASVESAAMKG